MNQKGNSFINILTMMKKIIFLTFFFILLINNLSFSQQYNVYQEKEFKYVNKVLKIIADESTYDKNYGDSYRVIRIFLKLQDNTLKKSKKFILPVSYRFPDYPYSFSASYEGERNFVIIRENSSFFIYDLDKDKLSKQIFPRFEDTEYTDAQSGMIITLKVDNTGKYLTVHAQDMGDFHFDLSDLFNPQQIKNSEIPSVITITSDEVKSKTECKQYTPAPGTAERKAILDALREEVYRIHKLKVIFVVPYLKVFNGWAWVHTIPQSPDGTNKYEDISALIHNKEGYWYIAEIPCSDPAEDDVNPDCLGHKDFFKNLMKRFPKAPECIFPADN